MKSPPPKDSLTGTLEEVAAFFRVSIRTLHEWKEQTPPAIGHWQLGRNICFGEEDVIDAWVKRHRPAAGINLSDALESARRQWREHLKVCRADLLHAEINDLRRRLDHLERFGWNTNSQYVPLGSAA